MNLVMFDIDGTLTNTNEVDHLCFVQALSEILQRKATDTDWTQYEHVTDQGCLEEFILRNIGRPATRKESTRIKKRHIELLGKYAEIKPELFRPIPGAVEILEDLKIRPEVKIGLATGAWLESAIIKLRTAGFLHNHIPMATGSDAISRENIMTSAERKVVKIAGVNSFRTRTYVGDAPWDVQAANKLGYAFIGIADGSRAHGLREAGSNFIVKDFRKPEHFLGLLEMIWAA